VPPMATLDLDRLPDVARDHLPDVDLAELSDRLADLDPSSSPLVDLVHEVEGRADLDDLVARLHEVLPDELREGPWREVLGGAWLGHALHPVLTDLPIGFWTSAWVLDLVPSKRTDRIATAFVALGLATAVPTIITGLSDWATLGDRKLERVGVVHLAANGAAVGCYSVSLLHRLRGNRKRGQAWGMAGAAAATAGGLLGGHLASKHY
jgi:uncharacterized membrane protein